MALTQSFKQQIKAAPPPGTVPQGQPMTPEQFKAWAAPTSSSSNPIDTIKEAAHGGVQQVKEGFQQSNEAKNPLELVEGAAKMGAGAFNTAFSPLAPVTKPIGTAVNAVADKISDIPAVQTFATSKAGEATARAAEDVGNLATIAGGVAGTKGAPEAKAAIEEKIPSPTKAAPKSAVAVERETAAANAEKAHTMIDAEVRNTAEKYGDVGKALNNAEVTKGTEPIKVLSSYAKGEALPTMSKLGKMNSLPAINFLRKQISGLGKIKGDLVDTADKNISVKDFQKTIEDKIDSSNGSVASKNAQKADIAKEMERYSKDYPDGIPTKEMDKLKTEQGKESSSYKTTGFPSRFEPDTHSLIANTAKGLVEKQGGEAPIEELNKWIQTHHDAIKVLEKMHGKTPHGGMFSRHVGGIAGEIAGLAGGMAVGHPFIGAMAGRGASEVVNNLLSSHFISNPLKRSIITSMKGAKPDVIQKALDFIDESDKTSPEATPGQSSQKVEEPTSPNDSKPPPKVQGAIPETSQIIKQATEYQPEFEKSVNEIAKAGDWQVKHGKVKTEDRASEKLANEGGTLRDANRSTIIVKDPSQLSSVVEAIKGQFPEVTRVKDKFDSRSYKSAIINVKTPMGHESEIAVTTPDMWKAKTELGGQKMYKQLRSMPDGTTKEYLDLEKKMEELYHQAAVDDASSRG